MRVINDTHLNPMTIIRHEGKLGHTEHMGKETQQNRSLRCDTTKAHTDANLFTSAQELLNM